jgi:hypothetical protein
MHLTKKTIFLAVIILDYIVCNDEKNTILPKIYLYAGVSVMLASKSIELNDKVVYITTLKHYLNGNIYA